MAAGWRQWPTGSRRPATGRGSSPGSALRGARRASHQPQAKCWRVPVEHHRGLRADPRARDDPLKGPGADGAVVGVLQVAVDVPQHGAVDVPVVIGGRAYIDFDHPHQRVVQVRCQPLPSGEDLAACTVARPGCCRVCCRLHGNLLGTLVAFRDRSTAAPLPSRCDDVGETLGWSRRALAQVSHQVTASNCSYRLRVAGLGETPSWSRRHSLSKP